VNLLNNLICNNNAGIRGGGLAAKNGTTLRCHNNTITENTASVSGTGGMYWPVPLGPMTLYMTNTIIWQNYSDSSRDLEEDIDGNGRNLTITNCIIGKDLPENQVRYIGIIIPFDPIFVDPANENYRLSNNSPAINTGTDNYPWAQYMPEFDLDGNPRVYQGYLPIVDIGCYEFQGDPVVQYIFEGFDEDTMLCADSVYVYTDIYIPHDVSVIICPGTYVMHMDPDNLLPTRDRGYSYSWEIEGCLFAVGTEQQYITFTSQYTSMGWSGLSFVNGDNNFYTSRLKYCNLEYADNFDLGYARSERHHPLEYPGGAVTLQDYSNIRISYCNFNYNKGEYGGAIGVHGESYPYIQNNTFQWNLALAGGGIFWSPNYYNNYRDSNRPIVVDSTFKVINNVFKDCWAVSGGGVYLHEYLGFVF